MSQPRDFLDSLPDTRVKKGKVAISGVPFDDDREVRVIVIPRATLQKVAYREVPFEV